MRRLHEQRSSSKERWEAADAVRRAKQEEMQRVQEDINAQSALIEAWRARLLEMQVREAEVDRARVMLMKLEKLEDPRKLMEFRGTSPAPEPKKRLRTSAVYVESPGKTLQLGSGATLKPVKLARAPSGRKYLHIMSARPASPNLEQQPLDSLMPSV